MESHPTSQVVELRLGYRYATQHPWVVPAVTGFLSAYFMEKPGFCVHQHFVELESGMHVWVCDIPSGMKVLSLVRRLKEDLPPSHCTEIEGLPPARPQYILDNPQSEPKGPGE